MTITENIVSSYLDCRYKSFLKITSKNGENHLLQERYDNDILEYTGKFKEFLIRNKKSVLVFEDNSNPVEIVKSTASEYFFNTFLRKDVYEGTVIIKKKY
jgi:hypothetical protein